MSSICKLRVGTLAAAFAFALFAAAGPPQAPFADARARTGAGATALPDYDIQLLCAPRAAPREAADCVATEQAFKWAMTRLWPGLAGAERDQAEICLRTIAHTLPDAGSFRALAECVSGVSNTSE